jgi:hypothetical protein
MRGLLGIEHLFKRVGKQAGEGSVLANDWVEHHLRNLFYTLPALSDVVTPHSAAHRADVLALRLN